MDGPAPPAYRSATPPRGYGASLDLSGELRASHPYFNGGFQTGA